MAMSWWGWRFVPGLIAVAAVGLAFIAYIRTLTTWHVDWGTAPDWITAVGTVLAFAAAVAVFSHDLQRKRHDEARMQAELVTAWPTYYVDTKQGLVQIRNASDGAVYRVALIFEQEVELAGDGSEMRTERSWFDRVPPGLNQADVGGVGAVYGKNQRLGLGFTDQRGRHWYRDPVGKLGSLPEPLLDRLEREGTLIGQGFLQPVLDR
jgi:hypothetical protein